MFGVVILVAENLKTDQAHNRRNLIAVFPEFFKVLETVFDQVAFDSQNHLLEVFLGNLVITCYIRQRYIDRTGGFAGIGAVQAGLKFG